MKFELMNTDGRARRGRMSFARGDVETPAFMPVGTYGTVKAMTPEELTENGAQIVLGNTFHLMLRPGMDVIRAHGGLHRFMHWERPILTDSGGFQVFSLATLRKITEEGVSFRSPHKGDPVLLTPERSMQVQRDLDADIAMIFDECTPFPATEEEARRSMELSLRWAGRSRAEFARLRNPHAGRHGDRGRHHRRDGADPHHDRDRRGVHRGHPGPVPQAHGPRASHGLDELRALADRRPDVPARRRHHRDLDPDQLGGDRPARGDRRHPDVPQLFPREGHRRDPGDRPQLA